MPSPANHVADVVLLTVKAALAPIQERLAALGERLAALAELPRELVAVRERVAVAEVRQLVAGPPGPAGRDGLGFDDLGVEYDGERTITLIFAKGGEVKRFPLALPFLKYQGVYQDGKLYAPGDVVTSGGAAWHCNAVSALKPGEGAGDWSLMVKRGAQGSQGIPGRDAYPEIARATGSRS